MWPTVSDLCKKPPGMKRSGPTRPAFQYAGPTHAEQLLLPRNASQAATGQWTMSRYVSIFVGFHVSVYVWSQNLRRLDMPVPLLPRSLWSACQGAGGERETCASTAFICNGSYSYQALMDVLLLLALAGPQAAGNAKSQSQCAYSTTLLAQSSPKHRHLLTQSFTHRPEAKLCSVTGHLTVLTPSKIVESV